MRLSEKDGFHVFLYGTARDSLLSDMHSTNCTSAERLDFFHAFSTGKGLSKLVSCQVRSNMMYFVQLFLYHYSKTSERTTVV